MQLSQFRSVGLGPRAILTAGVMALALWSPFTLCAENPGQQVVGRWKLTSILDASHVASIDEKQARKLIGHIFVIGKDGARLDKETCGRSDFESEHVEPNLYLQRADPYVTGSSLALPSPVTVVDISCTSVFIKRKDRLVIFWSGFYFDAVRVQK